MDGIQAVLYLAAVVWGFAFFHVLLAIQSSHCKPEPKALKGMYIQQIGINDDGF
jgi:hypothetical protein